MKVKNVKNKLTLNKKTIVHLAEGCMKDINGGACDCDCDCTCCCPYPDVTEYNCDRNPKDWTLNQIVCNFNTLP
ncbi:MAG: hypothetical protein GY765_04855 [bacterium]|nr:hypothetical protein [bacterium]